MTYTFSIDSSYFLVFNQQLLQVYYWQVYLFDFKCRPTCLAVSSKIQTFLFLIKCLKW